MSNTLSDLKQGLAEYHSAKNPSQKAFSRRVIQLILWENRHEIIEALSTLESIMRQS